MSEQPTHPSRWIDWLIRVGLASRPGRLLAEYLAARWLTRPSRLRICRTPSHLGLDWEPLWLRTADGHRLRGWLVTPPRPRATLILFHGIHNTREQMLTRLEFLVPAGFRCLALDHRAHGQSQGRISSFGLHESRDVTAVVEHARLHWSAQPLALLGVSMGAAAISYAAARVRQSAQAVILESLYHDVLTAFQNRLQVGDYPDYFQQLTVGVIRQCERLLRQPASRFSPAEYVGQLAPVPILFLTGSEDRHATPDEAIRLYEKRQGPAQLVLVPGTDHDNVCEGGGEVYRRAVLDFLERSLFGALLPLATHRWPQAA